MLFILAGNSLSLLSLFFLSVFLLIYSGINIKESDQGGLFALLQRFYSTLDEQLALPHSGEGDCTNDSRKTGIASGIWRGRQFKILLLMSVTLSTSFIRRLYLNLHSHLSAGLNASCPVNLNSVGYNFIKQPAETEPLFHSLALQQYILLCAQVWIWPIVQHCGNLMPDGWFCNFCLPDYC